MTDDRGRPDLHDPLAGFGGAPPAHSALTLRMVLAVFGLAVCAAGAVAAGLLAATFWCVVLAVAAAIALIDIAVIAVRMARGDPG
jgi:hypothetical protein